MELFGGTVCEKALEHRVVGETEACAGFTFDFRAEDSENGCDRVHARSIQAGKEKRLEF
jgi:hypothetical protein